MSGIFACLGLPRLDVFCLDFPRPPGNAPLERALRRPEQSWLPKPEFNGAEVASAYYSADSQLSCNDIQAIGKIALAGDESQYICPGTHE
jgi:hypothetical protein